MKSESQPDVMLAMASSSKKESHRQHVVFSIRRWVILLMTLLFSSGLCIYWVQSQLVPQPRPQLHKQSDQQLREQQALIADLKAQNYNLLERAQNAEEKVREVEAELEETQEILSVTDEVTAQNHENVELQQRAEKAEGQKRAVKELQADLEAEAFTQQLQAEAKKRAVVALQGDLEAKAFKQQLQAEAKKRAVQALQGDLLNAKAQQVQAELQAQNVKLQERAELAEAQVRVMQAELEVNKQKQSQQQTNVQLGADNAQSAQMPRFLQPKNRGAHKDEQLTEAVAKQGKYIGPWKMTYASADPTAARDFCMKYLGADHYYFTFPGMPSCAELQWVEFRGKPLEGEVPKPWKKSPFRFFQFHFVKHHRRPTGPMTIVELEQKLAKMHGNFTAYDQFMDMRVTLETDDLDPIAAKLLHDQKPVLARKNVDGTFSLFMEVPHAIVLEVVAPKLTVLKPQAWSRCDGFLPPAEVDWSLVASQLDIQVQDVRPRGFVYASTKPQAAANLHASYFLGQHSEKSSLLLERGNGTCFDARAVQWSQPDGINKFEFQWIHWPQTQPGALNLKDFERYQLQLRSNFSASHANNWDHYMDSHAGLFIEDCDPVIERLRADGVPHFLTPHFMKFMAVFIQDAGGLVYEVVCHKFSIVKLRDLPQWDFCKRLPPLAIDWSPLSNITS